MQKPLKENIKDTASSGNNTLEGLHINKNNVSEAKGTATETTVNAQNA